MSHNEQLLTSRDVAARKGVTVTTVNRWVNSGKLTPAVEVPGYRGARLFDEESVDALEADAS